MDRLPVRHEQDGVVLGPGASARVGRIREDLRRTASKVDALESATRKETERTAVGRPEQLQTVFSGWQRAGHSRIKRSHPDDILSRGIWRLESKDTPVGRQHRCRNDVFERLLRREDRRPQHRRIGRPTVGPTPRHEGDCSYGDCEQTCEQPHARRDAMLPSLHLRARSTLIRFPTARRRCRANAVAHLSPGSAVIVAARSAGWLSARPASQAPARESPQSCRRSSCRGMLGARSASRTAPHPNAQMSVRLSIALPARLFGAHVGGRAEDDSSARGHHTHRR